MLSQAGHGLVVVENARSLARDWGGDLGQVPESRFRNWARLGFGAILLTEMWQEPAGGSPGGVESFAPDQVVGGSQGLALFRYRASNAGLSLLLDFPPFQVAENNPVTFLQPYWTINQALSPGMDLAQGAWTAREVEPGQFLAIARGKDPYFPPVPCSAQLNPCLPGLREHMESLLARIATWCDGAWFKAAMLALPVGVEMSWGEWRRPSQGGAFLEDSPWPTLLDAARDLSASFLGLAEGYWGLEWELMGQGFNYCLDQRLTQRLTQKDWNGVTEHLSAPWDYLRKTLHRWDEPQSSLDGSTKQDAMIAWSLFLAAPGLKLVDSCFLEHNLLAKVADAREPWIAFSTALKATSELGGEWEFRLVEFPGKRVGFDGIHLGLVWTRRGVDENGDRHLLFLAKLEDGGGTEFDFDVKTGICHSVRPVPADQCPGQNLNKGERNRFHGHLAGRSCRFFEIGTNMD